MVCVMDADERGRTADTEAEALERERWLLVAAGDYACGAVVQYLTQWLKSVPSLAPALARATVPPDVLGPSAPTGRHRWLMWPVGVLRLPTEVWAPLLGWVTERGLPTVEPVDGLTLDGLPVWMFGSYHVGPALTRPATKEA